MRSRPRRPPFILIKKQLGEKIIGLDLRYWTAYNPWRCLGIRYQTAYFTLLCKVKDIGLDIAIHWASSLQYPRYR